MTGYRTSHENEVYSVLRFKLRLRIIVKQRSELSRATYRHFIASIPREMLLFIGELQRTRNPELRSHTSRDSGRRIMSCHVMPCHAFSFLTSIRLTPLIYV